jgi:hypothetical protein
MDGSEAEPRRWLLAGILFVLALGLRLVGIDYMLPHMPEPDVVYGVQLRGETLSLERYEHLTSYPLLVPELARLGRRLFPDRGPPRTLDEALSAAGAPIRDCRIIVAILASLAAPATFLCAAHFLSTRAAFVAGLLASTNVLAMCYSTQARPHAALGGLTAAMLASLLWLRSRPTWRAHIVAGAFLAAAVGVLHSALSLMLPLAAAFLLRVGPRAPRDWLKPVAALALCIPVAALGFALPTVRGPLEQSTQPEESVVWLGGHIVQLEHFRGGGFGVFFWTLWSYDVWLLALLTAGAVLGVLALRRWGMRAGLRTEEGKDALVLAAFALPYFVVFGLYDGNYARFMLPLVPVFCVMGAASAVALAQAARPLGRPFAYAVPGLLVAVQCAVALKLVQLRLLPDSSELAAAGLRAIADPERDRIWVAPGLELPLLASEGACERNRGELSKVGSVERDFWTRYQLEHELELAGETRFDTTLIPYADRLERGMLSPPSADELALAHPGVVLAGRVGAGGAMDFHRSMRAVLRARAEPMARFNGVPWGQEGRGLLYDRHWRDHPPYWLDVLRAEHFGPYLEITRLPQPESSDGSAKGN